MSMRVRLGALGCSSIAWRRTLPAVAAVDEMSLTAVASRSVDKAKRFAAEFGCEAMTYPELIEHPDIDAIYISLPTGLHYDWALRALAAGKHVLCEKPLTDGAAKTRELTDFAARRGLVLRENFTFLHHPQHKRVLTMVEDGWAGALRTFKAVLGIPPLPQEDIRYNAELGGGALLDVGVYPLRVAQFVLGENLRVAGATLRMDDKLDVDLAGKALLVSESGVFADLEFGFQHTYRSAYEFWGSDAIMTLERAFITPIEHRPVLRVDEQDYVTEISLQPADQFRACVSSFAYAVCCGSVADEDSWLGGANATARLVEAISQAAVRISDRGR